MARGFGIRHAWTEMGLAQDDIVSRCSFKIIQGPTSLAHIFLLCPNRRIIAIIQTVCGCDDSAVHFVTPRKYPKIFIIKIIIYIPGIIEQTWVFF